MTNFQTTFMQKSFPSNMKKQVLQKKNKAHNSQPVQVPPQGPDSGADTSVAIHMMQKSEKT